MLKRRSRSFVPAGTKAAKAKATANAASATGHLQDVDDFFDSDTCKFFCCVCPLAAAAVV